MPYGTAVNRLRKKVLFHLLCKLQENVCYRCEKPIEKEDDISLEHKIGWVNVSADLFWDLSNIGFSHTWCNYSHGTRQEAGPIVHGTRHAYANTRCKCDKCKEGNREYMRRYRLKART